MLFPQSDFEISLFHFCSPFSFAEFGNELTVTAKSNRNGISTGTHEFMLINPYNTFGAKFETCITSIETLSVKKSIIISNPLFSNEKMAILYPFHLCGGANQYYFYLSNLRHIFVCAVF